MLPQPPFRLFLDGVVWFLWSKPPRSSCAAAGAFWFCAIIYPINRCFMDFPLVLSDTSTLSFVYGYDELKQALYLLLKTWYGRFLQSPVIGSRVSPHVVEELTLRAGISATITQLRGCTCEDVRVSGDNVVVRVSYGGCLDDFEYSLSSFN